MPQLAAVLPHPLPACPHARLALFAVRRMGAHGLHDAQAAHAALTAFGRGFRRPLTLLRALVAELATVATGPIAVAPCCCPRMTPAEGLLIGALARADDEPDAAARLLSDVAQCRHPGGLLAAAAAVAAAFADEGRPIEA